MESRQWKFKAERVQSLVWHGDVLVDWVAGGYAYQLDGTFRDRAVNYAYPFDSAITSPTNKYSVIYEKLGTKGVILREGTIVREINRSFYHADVYEFPITFAQLNGGREVLIHCPEEYNQLEIDDVETGERLTGGVTRKPMDFFHSRLTVSPDGKYLMSAGWVWHPVDLIAVFDIEKAVQNPKRLDEHDVDIEMDVEISSATFLTESSIAVSTSSEVFDDDVEDDEIVLRLKPDSIAVYDLVRQEYTSVVQSKGRAGTMMAVGEQHVVTFYDYPKLIDLKTGLVVEKWESIKTGQQVSSIIHHIDKIPPLALDPARRRFAVANDDVIHVVELAKR